MMFSRLYRRSAALAAAAAIALQALWPLIAQARPGDSISVPVCSADGVRHDVELPLGKTQDGTQHCKLCVLGTDKPVVSNSAVPFLSSGEKSASVPEERQSPAQSSAAFTAHPRAPPQVS